MRDEKSQKALDSMTQAEKFIATSYEEMIERGSIVFGCNNWYLCHNEYPHKDRGSIQLVLRQRNNVDENEATVEMRKIRKLFKNMNMSHSGEENKSVTFREHIHIFSDN